MIVSDKKYTCSTISLSMLSLNELLKNSSIFQGNEPRFCQMIKLCPVTMGCFLRRIFFGRLVLNSLPPLNPTICFWVSEDEYDAIHWYCHKILYF